MKGNNSAYRTGAVFSPLCEEMAVRFHARMRGFRKSFQRNQIGARNGAGKTLEGNENGLSVSEQPADFGASFCCAPRQDSREISSRWHFASTATASGPDGMTDLCKDRHKDHHRCIRMRMPGSLIARPGYASEIEAAPFGQPSRRADVFQQRPRGCVLGTGHSSCASLPIPDFALCCRLGRLRPYSGHPSSFFGLRRFHRI